MKRILTIQDISCVGKCSLTVALPIISAAGVEASVLPTAVLSTHTMFPKYTFLDLTDEITPITDTFRELDIGFDAVYTGYLGSFRQIELVERAFEQAGEGCLTVVDPVMADNGKLYKGFTEEFAARMAKLCARADVVLPNLTEASFMLGIPYTEEYVEEYVRDVLRRLCALGARCAALTGIRLNEGKIGVYAYHSDTDTFFFYDNELLPVSFHGTGDIFASAFLGAHMRGLSIDEALTLAVDFTLESMKKTLADSHHRFYGVNFEEAIPLYVQRLSHLS